MQPQIPPEDPPANQSPDSRAAEPTDELLDKILSLCQRHQITAMDDFIASCRSFAQEEILNVAVLGRFKTGKSSFLNQFIGRPVLPVGVIPVTAVVIEIQYGREEFAEVRFLNGRRSVVPLESVREFVAEAHNPSNVKDVGLVHIEIPSMESYRGIRFVDTPGLESVFEKNTVTAMEWLPNVGLALVAVGADVPLSQHDIEFIRTLSQYTPNITVLLTKADILDCSQLAEVTQFIEQQIVRHLQRPLPIYPYSIRSGYEALRATLATLLSKTPHGAAVAKEAVLRHKLVSVTDECIDYLRLSLVSAEAADSERKELHQKVLGQRESLDDARRVLRLVVQNATAGSRSTFEALLRRDSPPLEERLLAELDNEFPSWVRSLAFAADAFDKWLRVRVTQEMEELSRKHQVEFLEPIRRARRQVTQSLEDFRNHLSERTLAGLGVPLGRREIDLRVEEPGSPDVRVGKIFDRHWELLSFIIPMFLIQWPLKRHFQSKVRTVVFVNLSRLASQWEEVVRAAVLRLQAESMRRLNGLISTIGKLLQTTGEAAPLVRADLATLDRIRTQVSRHKPASGMNTTERTGLRPNFNPRSSGSSSPF
jgi:GTP-binding protein EngB required for normal cell division